MKSVYEMDIIVKSDDGKKELKKYSTRYYNESDGFSWLGSSEPIKKLIERLPEYTRGKLKGEMQRCKFSDNLIISESYYNKLKQNQGADWTTKELCTRATFYFPEIPTLYITEKSDYQNALTILKTIERKVIGDYKNVTTYEDLGNCAEIYKVLTDFRNAKTYTLEIEKRKHFDSLYFLYALVGKERFFIGEYYAGIIKTLKPDVKLPTDKTITVIKGVLCASYNEMQENEEAFEEEQKQKMNEIIEIEGL